MLKKLFIGLVLALVATGVISYVYFTKFEKGKITFFKNGKVLGIESSGGKKVKKEDKIQNPITSNKQINKALEEAKESLSKVSSENFASSSAIIERVINDLKTLQSQGKEPVDIVCDLVCKDR